jgi:hypothetical protein
VQLLLCATPGTASCLNPSIVRQLERQTQIHQLHRWIPLLFFLTLPHSGFSLLKLVQRPLPLLVHWASLYCLQSGD